MNRLPSSLLSVKASVFSVLVLILLFSCARHSNETAFDNGHEKGFVSILKRISNHEDSLRMLLQECVQQGDETGMIGCYKYLGCFLRENARFTEAIAAHQEGLSLALKLKDTLEAVQAYNNLGTDLRRIGVLSGASNYHYQALAMTEAYCGANEPDAGMKNRMISLNGLGNISLTLGYYEEAEKYFRSALADEITLKSTIGQAINYANIGSIFEHRRQYDSAWVYYNRSMVKNREAGSDTGIGLCHIHFGDLHMLNKKYETAKAEYLKAYQLMENIADRWHWLEATLSLAHFYLLTGELQEFEKQIRLAGKTAHEINSPEHLAKIYALEHDYYYQQANYAEALKNYKQSVVMYDSIRGIQKSNIYLDMTVNYERNRNERRIAEIEAAGKAKDARRQFYLMILLGVTLAGGISTALLYYAYYQRNRSNKILKEMEQMRSDFFTNITHEFRTPLTVIEGLNRQIRSRKNLAEKEKALFHEAIDRQSRNLLDMVNQLLDLSKVKSGIDTPEWKHGNIVPFLRMTAETFRLYANNKGVELIFYSEFESHEMDFIPFYVDKIINNLLSNAVKHTRTGDRIHFIFSKGVHPDSVILRVTDTGEGIPPEDLERIFDLFYQSPHTHNSSGSGIGLSFVQMMVEKMYGTVEVESQPGKGSAFTVSLPVKNGKLKQIAPLFPSIGEKERAKERSEKSETTAIQPIETETDPSANEENVFPLILLVEDNKDIGTYLTSLLEESCRVVVARNGQEGLQMAEETIPDLIITDLMMPVMDGYRLCKAIKESRILNHIPIVILSAKGSDEDRIEGLRCGVEAFLRKPFRPDELLLLIHNIMKNRDILKKKYVSSMIRGQNDNENKNSSDENIRFLKELTDIIVKEINNPELNAALLADKMGISISQLNRKLTAIAGCSSISYVLKIKLNKAKKMLTETDQSISYISGVCGFFDANYFSRAFKKEFGITPSQCIRKK